MTKLGAIEIFLLEFVLFLVFWVSNEYIGSLLSAIFAPMALLLFIIAWISERLEPSRVPKWYFTLMICSFLAPVAAALVYWFVINQLV